MSRPVRFPTRLRRTARVMAIIAPAVLAHLAASPPPAWSGTNVLSVGSGSGAGGSQVAVPLGLANEDVVKALQTDVQFDPAVVSYVSGSATGRGSGMSFSAAVIGGNKVRVVLYYADQSTLVAGSGPLANLTFSLVGAGGSQTALTPSATVLSDPEGQPLSVTDQAGSISVAGGGGTNILSIGTGSGTGGSQVAVPLGLANEDVVKALQTDVQFDPAVVSYVSGSATGRGAGMSFSAAVVEGNKVRVVLYYADQTTLPAGSGPLADLTFSLVGAGGTQTALTPSATVLSDPGGQPLSVTNQAGSISVTGGGGTNVLSVGSGSGAGGSEVTVPLSLANEDVAKALQTDIQLDPAIVAYARGAATGRGAGMSFSAAVVDGNKLRVILYYADQTTLPAGSGPIANLTFSLAGAGGTQTALTPTATILSDPNGQPLPVTTQAGSISITVANQPPDATILSPNGGESYEVGSSVSITYTATDPDTPPGGLSISLDYSTDGGTTWTPIATGQSNSGSYAWTVPDAPTTLARARITASDGELQDSDASNANFTIREPPHNNELSIGSAVGMSGTQASVSLGLANEDVVKTLQGDIEFDPAVVAYVGGAVTDRGIGMTYTASATGNRVSYVLTYSGQGTLAPGTGDLAGLTFSLLGATGSQTSLVPANSVLRDATGNPLNLTASPGGITITGTALPPALRVTALKNPGRTRIVQIFVVANQDLATLSVTASGAPVAMSEIDAGRNIYHGIVRVGNGESSVAISATGSNAIGAGHAETTVTF